MTATVAPLLTARQRHILDFIRAYKQRHGFPPSLREVAAATGLASPSSVVHQLKGLELAGWIRRVPGLPRTLQLLDPATGQPDPGDEVAA